MDSTLFGASDASHILWSVIKPALPLLILLSTIRVLQEVGPGLWDAHVRKKNFKRGNQWRSDQDLIRWLRGMHPNEFEEYIVSLFQKLGYKTFRNGGPHDGGIDVVAEKEGVQHFIQCKKFVTSQVSVSAIRDFYGAMAGKASSGKGFFITTNKFSLDAEKFADDKPIELVDSFTLVKYIRIAEQNGFNPEPKKTERNCPKCGGRLLERTGKFGKFIGCSNFPECKHTEKT